MTAFPEEVNDEKTAKYAADLLFRYLKNLIYNPSDANLDPSELPEEFINLGKGLAYYGLCVSEVTTLARELSRGELNGMVPSRGNEIASPLKSLQASLKHLTWQTKQVAKGDYRQQVSFMGEFADSFNTMIDQLSQQREALLSEIETNKKKSEALSQNNNLLEFITENISQWIVVIDRASSEWLYVNRDVSAVLRNMKNEQILRDWLCDQIMAISHGHAVRMLEFNLKCEGPTQYFSVAVHPLHWYEHDAAAFVFMDVSYEKRQLHELETAAYYDPLTNMFNRHYGMELLAKWLAEGISFVICFVDLDNLKFVNDKYGHAAGDTYILKVVEILQMFSFEAATCRLGGDEFMVLSHYCGLEEAENELEELRTLLKSNPDGGDIGGYYSISFGVVEALAGDTLTAGELLGIADEKMYKYKRAHKAQRDRKPSSPEQPDANRALLEGNGDSV